MVKPQNKVPSFTIDLVNDTQWSLQDQTPDNFTMIVFYRGKHCPVCKKYLELLQNRIDEFLKRGVNIIAISADPEERAKKTYEEWEIANLPVGFDFPIDKAREFGLYVSKGINDREPREFIEPGLFIIQPDSTLYSVSIQSMPFARPDFGAILKGLDYILENDYPARGEA